MAAKTPPPLLFFDPPPVLDLGLVFLVDEVATQALATGLDACFPPPLDPLFFGLDAATAFKLLTRSSKDSSSSNHPRLFA